MSSRWLDTSLAYLKGIGPLRAEALAGELGLRTFGDLVAHYPYRYVDRSVVLRIRELQPGPAEVQGQGTGAMSGDNSSSSSSPSMPAMDADYELANTRRSLTDWRRPRSASFNSRA